MNRKLLRELQEDERRDPPADDYAEIATRLRWLDTEDLSCITTQREAAASLREGEELARRLRGIAAAVERGNEYRREHLAELRAASVRRRKVRP